MGMQLGLWRLLASGSTLLDGLVSYWPLNELSGVRYDSVGDNDLTDNNTVLYVPTGPKGTVANFVAANTEYLSSASTLTLTQAFTTSVWVYYDAFIGAYPAIWNVMGGAWPTTVQFSLHTVGGVGGNFTPVVGGAGGNSQVVVSTVKPATGQWFHVVCWYDDLGDRKIRMSINDGAVDVGALAVVGALHAPGVRQRRGRGQRAV